MNSAAKTALVLKYVTRCEYGEDLSLGYLAEPLDRVTVLSKFTTSNGTVLCLCRTEDRETFQVTGGFVQFD